MKCSRSFIFALFSSLVAFSFATDVNAQWLYWETCENLPGSADPPGVSLCGDREYRLACAGASASNFIGVQVGNTTAESPCFAQATGVEEWAPVTIVCHTDASNPNSRLNFGQFRPPSGGLPVCSDCSDQPPKYTEGTCDDIAPDLVCDEVTDCQYERSFRASSCGYTDENPSWWATYDPTGDMCLPEGDSCENEDGTINKQCFCNLEENEYHAWCMSDYCEQHPNAPSCFDDEDEKDNFCQENPTHPACQDGPGDFCQENPTHPSCQDDGYCDRNPHMPGCFDFCTKYPAHPVCTDNQSFCEENPNHVTCKEGDFCEENPDHPACTMPGDFCEENPEHPSCIEEEFCDRFPDSPACIDDLCDEFPDHPFCSEEDYCTQNPDDPICVDCKANPDDPLCNIGYCDLYPDDPNCLDVGDFCLKNPSAMWCMSCDNPHVFSDWCTSQIPCYGPGCEPDPEGPGGFGDNYAAGSQCDMGAPQCSSDADPVGCALLWQMWYGQCDTSSGVDLTGTAAELTQVASQYEAESDAIWDGLVLAEEEIDIESLDTTQFLPGSCPAARELSIMGASITVPIDPICDLATTVRPIVLALFAIFSLGIIIRGL